MNTWNGRSYAQVVARKRKLLLPGPCILQTPDSNANARKLKHFLKINKPLSYWFFYMYKVSKQTSWQPSHGKHKKGSYMVYISGYTASSQDLNVGSLKLTNRFHGLSLDEDMVQDHSVEDFYHYLVKMSVHQEFNLWTNISIQIDIKRTNIVTKSNLTDNGIQVHHAENKTANHVAQCEDKISPQVTGEQMRNVPIKVWLNRFQCTDQMHVLNRGSKFGYIPLTN